MTTPKDETPQSVPESFPENDHEGDGEFVDIPGDDIEDVDDSPEPDEIQDEADEPTPGGELND